MRSVGPNLVVALLMDGPQLTARWPARYASVLADDPGSSVLTLTSLGMCLRSRSTTAPAAPKEFPVVFLFSGESGKPFGYNDGWKDQIFEYTGEDQKGPMTFRAGNKAIRDHRKNGKDLLLFIDLGKGKGVRLEGLFECASYREIDGVDKDRHERKIIVFDLVPVTTAATEVKNVESVDTESEGAPAKSIETLRDAAYAAATAIAAPPRSR
jgi:5-methylcytosine-specific restriction enzyme A